MTSRIFQSSSIDISGLKMEISYTKDGLTELLAAAGKVGEQHEDSSIQIYKNHVIAAFFPPEYRLQIIIGTFDLTRETGFRAARTLSKKIRDEGILNDVVWLTRVLLFEDYEPRDWIREKLDLPWIGDRHECMQVANNSWTLELMMEYARTLI